MSLINIKDNLIEGAIFYPSPNHDSRPKNIDISLIVVHAISLPPGKYGGNEIKDFFLNKFDKTDLSSSNFKGLPSMVSGTFKIKFLKNHQFAYALISRNRYEVDLSFNTDIVDNEFTNELPGITKYFVKTYSNLSKDRLVGHSDIAPGRKTDPGSGIIL